MLSYAAPKKTLEVLLSMRCKVTRAGGENPVANMGAYRNIPPTNGTP